jgi:hypothetical protein
MAATWAEEGTTVCRSDDELQRIRVELDHLVSIRYAAGLTPYQQRRYEELLDREVQLLGTYGVCA